MEYELQKLFNLTYEGKQYVSTIAPTNYPVDNYSFVEITYNSELVIHVKGEYIWQGKKEEILLSDLDFFSYCKVLKKIVLDIEFMGLTEEQQPKNKNHLIFILSVCSYLVYFHFQQFPCELSLDLLDHTSIQLFTSDHNFDKNLLFEAWNKQVSYFAKTFGYLFPLNSSVESLKVETKGDKEIINNKSSDSKIRDVNNDKTKLKKYIKKTVKKYVEKELQLAIHKLGEEAEEIAKEMKEYKRRLIADITKKEEK